jgi:hypothetical protein
MFSILTSTFLLLFSYEVEITSEVTGHAPTPVLNVGVRQDGTLIGK